MFLVIPQIVVNVPPITISPSGCTTIASTVVPVILVIKFGSISPVVLKCAKYFVAFHTKPVKVPHT